MKKNYYKKMLKKGQIIKIINELIKIKKNEKKINNVNNNMWEKMYWCTNQILKSHSEIMSTWLVYLNKTKALYKYLLVCLTPQQLLYI